MRLLHICTLCLAVFSSIVSSKQIVRVINLNDPQKETLTYFYQILDEALQITRPEWGDYEIQQVSFNAAQNRSLTLLQTPNVLDVMHTMQDQELDARLIKVEQDLLNGLLGTRVFLVNKNNEQEFSTLTAEQLKLKTACQGIHWRDSDILDDNGYTVHRVGNFESIFKMLGRDRCDYFPRGINEIDADFNTYQGKYSELAIVTSLLFKYDAPMHFYLGQHNKALAQRIEQGIEKLGGSDYIKTKINQSSFKQSMRFLQTPNVQIITLQTKPSL